jgi:hypothetical protein
MESHPLRSLAAYSQFVAEALQHPCVLHSTVQVWSDSPFTGIAEGEVHATAGFRLRPREELDFDARLITAYGYEFYCGEERLCWYDDFPHPEDPKLASTFPHHQHVPPDLRHNRIPAPELSFDKPNLPFLLGKLAGFSA